MSVDLDPGSFRDRAGFVFRKDGVVLRQVEAGWADVWNRVRPTYEQMAARGLVVPIEDVPIEWAASATAAVVVKPKRVPFISYPYEWSFSQLKDAAMTTLEVMKAALEKDLWLRDASAYNVQFIEGAPVLIDTLSLEPIREGMPWPAYGQFCRHFLAPLALMSYVDLRLVCLMRTSIDGIPLDLASRLMPAVTKFNVGLALHLHAHGKATAKAHEPVTRPTFSKQALLGLVDSLETTVRKLDPPKQASVWGDYYDHTNYDRESFERKRVLVRGMLETLKPDTVWDLGANTGVFSELAAESAGLVVAFDFDPNAVESAYLRWKMEKRANLLPILLDLTNPSPNLGWGLAERSSIEKRGNPDVLMALALIHHLAIGNNVPLRSVASWMATLAPKAIVEFVPKADSQVVRMLSSREDVFDDYDESGFEAAFSSWFDISAKQSIEGSCRTLYCLERRQT